jgi:hypothetical protein
LRSEAEVWGKRLTAVLLYTPFAMANFRAERPIRFL